MPVRIEVSALESPVGEWLASLVVVLACAAFALLLYFGPRPAMDRAQIDAPPVRAEPAAAATVRK